MYHHIYNLMAPMRTRNGALMIIVLIRHFFAAFLLIFLTDRFSPRPSSSKCTDFKDSSGFKNGLPLPLCQTFGKTLTLSEPLFPFRSVDNTLTHVVELLWDKM